MTLSNLLKQEKSTVHLKVTRLLYYGRFLVKCFGHSLLELILEMYGLIVFDLNKLNGRV